MVSAVVSPAVWGIGEISAIARLFLITNALLCYGLARLATKERHSRA